MANQMAILSKSRYLQGLQCPKLLWVNVNDKSRLPEIDISKQHIFDQGHLVGNLAKALFSDGVDVPTENFKENIEKTKVLLDKRKPLFEGGFMVDGLFARPDILNPVNNNKWDLIEVKSSTSVKDINIEDVAFQKYVYEKQGLIINKCFLLHVNNKYVKNGKINPNDFFVKEDITADVNSAQKNVQERITYMFSIINGIEPAVNIGQGCLVPYKCDLIDQCWNFLPENNVGQLCCVGNKLFELLNDGIYYIKDIPDDYELTPRQRIQKDCEFNGGQYVQHEKLSEWLEKLEYPLYYFDFETFNSAIPLFEGVRPYQQIPFQFSLHVQNEPGGELLHYSFLADNCNDPRPELLASMKKLIGDEGSIVVYNQSFEIGRLREMAGAFPDYEDWVETLIPRFVDLIVPFRKFWYYNSCQNGSASIKKVLPALTGQSYDNMQIGDGGTASLEFFRITYGGFDGKFPSENQISQVRNNLEKYCCLDTEGMAWIVDKLREL
ncbi:MAG: DUF2779 domain-containing protein [Nanobdellota archaeon]